MITILAPFAIWVLCTLPQSFIHKFDADIKMDVRGIGYERGQNSETHICQNGNEHDKKNGNINTANRSFKNVENFK